MRIIVNPDQLRQVAQQLHRANSDLRGASANIGRIVGSMSLEIRARTNVDERAVAARRQAEGLANQAESLARFLEDRAEAFRRADEQGSAFGVMQNVLVASDSPGVLGGRLPDWVLGSILGGALFGIGDVIVKPKEMTATRLLSEIPKLLEHYMNWLRGHEGETNPEVDNATVADGLRIDLDKEFENFVNNREEYTAEYVGYPRDGISKWLAQQLGFHRKDITEQEAGFLDELSLPELKKMSDVHDEAFAVEESIFGEAGNNDGIGDAFRHTFWSARLTQEYGAEWAKGFTDAHESKPENAAARDFMDRWNNELGIRIAETNPGANPSALAELIAQAIENGEGVYIPGADQYRIDSDERNFLAENGPLAYTNQEPSVQNLPDHIDIDAGGNSISGN